MSSGNPGSSERQEIDGESPILVTGATGFVGAVLCRHLLAAGHRVRALRRPGTPPAPAACGIDWVEGDLLDPASLERACAGCDRVIHLAAQAQTSERYAREAMRVNVEGTRALLAAAHKQGMRRFIFVSSVLAGAVDETRSAGSYARSKREAEKLIEAELGATTTEYVILRPVNVYGPGMAGSLKRLISGIRGGWLPRLPDLGARLALIGRGDLISVIEQCLASDAVTGKTYLVSDGHAYSLREIEQAIYAAVDRSPPRWRLPAVLLYAAATLVDGLGALVRRPVGLGQTLARLSESREVSNEALVRDLGFVPSESFHSALPAIIQEMEQTRNPTRSG